MTSNKVLETLLEICEESNASDLHLAVGLEQLVRSGTVSLRTALGVARYPAQLKRHLGVMPEPGVG